MKVNVLIGLHLSTHKEKRNRYIQYGPFFFCFNSNVSTFYDNDVIDKKNSKIVITVLFVNEFTLFS